MAVWLAQTQGAFLMTVKGIGMVLAAGVAAEIGDPATQRSVNNLTSYADGIASGRHTRFRKIVQTFFGILAPSLLLQR